MIEIEELIEPDVSHFDHRLSSYFTFTLLPQEDVSFVSTTYVQPKIDHFSDYRILHENSLSFGISAKLNFSLRFTLAYDRMPPVDIPELTYYLLNSLSYQF